MPLSRPETVTLRREGGETAKRTAHGAHSGKAALRFSLTPQTVFLMFAIIVGLTAVFCTPVGGGLDEPQHIARIEQVAHGQMTPTFVGYAQNYPTDTQEEKNLASLYGGEGDATLFDLGIEGLRNLQAGLHRYSFPLWNDPESHTEALYGSQGTETHVFSNTAVNAPIVYLPYLIAFYLGRLINLPLYWLVIFMRLVGLAVFAAITFWCIRTIPIGKWVLAAIALLPATISTVATVSADTAAIALAFAFITLFVDFLYSDEARLSRWVALGIACLLLPLAKMAYTPFLGLLIVLPLVRTRLRTGKSIVALALFFAGGLVLLAVWYAVISGINTGAMWKPAINPGAQLRGIFDSPLHFLKILAYSLPFNDVTQATSMGVQGEYSYAYFEGFGWIGIVLLCVASQLHESSERALTEEVRRGLPLVFVAVAAVFLLCATLVYLALYLTFTEVGSDVIQGVQNRYFIPLAPLVLLPVSILSHWGAYGSKVATTTSVARVNEIEGTSSIDQTAPSNGRPLAILKASTVILSLAAWFAFIVVLKNSVF